MFDLTLQPPTGELRQGESPWI